MFEGVHRKKTPLRRSTYCFEVKATMEKKNKNNILSKRMKEKKAFFLYIFWFCFYFNVFFISFHLLFLPLFITLIIFHRTTISFLCIQYSNIVLVLLILIFLIIIRMQIHITTHKYIIKLII